MKLVRFLPLLIAVALPSRVHTSLADVDLPTPAKGLDVPIAMAWNSAGLLHVAARDGRCLYTIEPQRWRVVKTLPLDIRPASLASIDESRLLVGGADGDVRIVDLRDGRIAARLSAGRGTTRVTRLSRDLAAVASVWDWRVRILNLETGAFVATHPLEHAPGKMLARPGGRLLVLDAFRGRITDLDPGRPGSERTRNVAGANLLAAEISPDGKELLVGHMVPYGELPLTRANIDWGLILSSKLSAIPLTAFDEPRPADGELPARRLTLDGSGHGAADPSALTISRDGRYIVIALRGAHQALVVDRSLGGEMSAGLLPLGDSQRLVSVDVGRCPADISFDPTGRYFITTDSMSETLTVIKLDDLSQLATVQLADDPSTPTAAQRGERQFHDGRNSMDLWMSCASCHPAGHTTGFNFDTQADGGYGAAKNIPTLLGSIATPPYNWTGNTPTLPAQIHKSLRTTLQGGGLNDAHVADIVAYLRSMPSPPPVRLEADMAARRGANVFDARRCGQCHTPPMYTFAGVKDVGLDDGSAHNQRFNPPSLRGVSQSAPYFHDGRAETLRDVVGAHDPLGTHPLSDQDRDDLIAFLLSL